MRCDVGLRAGLRFGAAAVLFAFAAAGHAEPPRPSAPVGAPLPIVPPAGDATAAATPAGTAAAATKPFVPMAPAVAIAKANAYLTSVTTMIGDFVQIGADGRRAEGRLFVQKPGRLRFEYADPATLEIVADGTSVAVRDRKLLTQDMYFIKQTPLKFLLSDKIDLSRDTKILDVTSDPTSVSILIEDSTTLGGTSRIKLVFDPAKFTLKQWQVTDPQGYETLVSLFNVDTSKKPDPSLFRINNF